MPLLTPHTAADGSLTWLPVEGRPEQLMVLLHGVGSSALAMLPLARALRAEFPQAALVAAQGFEAFDAGGPGHEGRQWFSIAGVTEENRPARVAAALPRLVDRVKQIQRDTGVGPAATALVGFSQGAVMALELAQREDGLAGRVLAFAGRYASLPTRAPQATTLHFFHGAADEVIPAQHARAALQRLAELQGDATVDIAAGIGHELPPALMRCAIQRLRTHIPHRTWAAALGAVPGLAQHRSDVDGASDDPSDDATAR